VSCRLDSLKSDWDQLGKQLSDLPRPRLIVDNWLVRVRMLCAPEMGMEDPSVLSDSIFPSDLLVTARQTGDAGFSYQQVFGDEVQLIDLTPEAESTPITEYPR